MLHFITNTGNHKKGYMGSPGGDPQWYGPSRCGLDSKERRKVVLFHPKEELEHKNKGKKKTFLRSKYAQIHYHCYQYVKKAQHNCFIT